MLTLRPYQEQVLADLWQWFVEHDEGDPVVEACVGAGKSVLIAELCRRALAQFAETRILMVVHVKELIEQNLAKLLQVWPEAPVGAYSASLGARQLGRSITYATIGSVAKRAHELGRVDLLLVDECHLISPDEATMYRRLIDELRRYCPAMRVVGWTGTAFRGDGIWLTEQGLFTHVAARITMGELLRSGYLAPLVAAPAATRIDTHEVKMVAGEFAVSSLAKASDKAELVRDACAEIVRLAAERRRWLIFAVTVQHAEHIRDELRERHGIPCAVVSAKTPDGERAASIAAFRRGGMRALINVAVLTTGFDAPEVDCIALLRATNSPVLYVQIAGRGMRTAEGKSDCLWLDFTDTTERLGPVDQIKGRSRPRKRDGEAQGAPFKTCDNCGNPSPTAVLSCPHCGAAFPEPERVTHAATAGAASPLAGGPQWHTVSRIDCRYWDGRDGKQDTMRVDYWSGLRIVASEWICVEHPLGTYARAKASAWWDRRGAQPVPTSVNEALERQGELLAPERIAVQRREKFPEIVSFEWPKPKESPFVHPVHQPGRTQAHPPGPEGEPAAL